MIGIDNILGMLGVKPEQIAELRALLSPEKIAAGIAIAQGLEARLTAMETQIKDIHAMACLLTLPTQPESNNWREELALQYAPISPGMVPPPIAETLDPAASNAIAASVGVAAAPFDTSTGAATASREGETIPPIFQAEMDKQLEKMLRENGVSTHVDGSSDGSGLASSGSFDFGCIFGTRDSGC